MALTSTNVTNILPSIYTSDGSSAITTVYFCNTGDQIAYLTVHAVGKFDMPTDQNIIYYRLPIAINDTFIMDTEKIILEDGDSLFANLEVNYAPGSTKVVCTVSTIGI